MRMGLWCSRASSPHVMRGGLTRISSAHTGYGARRREIAMQEMLRQSDPATFEIIKNSLYKIAEEMRVVLAKTAYSPLLKSAGDYSCGVFDVRGEMVAQGPDLPIHLGSMPDAVRAVIAAFADDVHEADVFVHNDPYFGGSHLPDVNVIRPAFHGGELLGYTCLRALAGYWLCHARKLRRGDANLRRRASDPAIATRQRWRPQCGS